MAQVEKDTLVFILRFWKEPREQEGDPSIWRGVIENVKTGQRHYFDDLNDLHSLLVEYLKSLSARPAARSVYRQIMRGIRRWLAKALKYLTGE